MRKEAILTAAVLAALSANAYAAEITLENNHTAGSNYNLVSSAGNIKLDIDNGPTTNNLILGGWSKYTGNSIYNIFSGTEIAPENRNVENIAIGDVVKIKDSDYGLMIGNHISNENDADSIKKYGRRSTMIKGDYITVKNSPHATVLGQDSTVTNSYGAFVHGKDNVVENATWSVVMGQGATAKLTTAEKGGSVVIGQKANTNSNFTIALGASAAAKNYAATAIGGGSTATGKYSLAMAQADSNGYGSIGIGMNAIADKEDSVSLGVKSKAIGERATAIGKNANAATTDTISIGSCSGATGVDGTAIGHCAKAEGQSSIAMGTTSKAKAEDSVAIGHLATANSDLSTAIGKEAEATESGSIALGYNAKAQGMNSIAIGSSKTVPGDPITTNTIAKGENVISIGYEAHNEASNSVAIGTNASVKHQVDDDGFTHYATYSTVVGTGAKSTSYGGTAYGYLAEVHGDDGVAVGHYATANGRRSNAIGYSAEAKADSSIAIGEDSEVNGEFGIAQGWQAKAEAESGIAIGKWAESKHVGSIALGSESRTADAVSTSSATINGKTYNFAGGEANSTLSIGVAKGVDEYGNEIKEVNRTITNVAAGRINDNSTDAVNGSQLHAVIKAVNEVAANDKDTITTVVAGSNTTVTNDGNHNYTVSVNKDLTNMNSVNLNDASGTKRARLDADKAHFFNDTTSTNTAVTSNGVAIENTDNLDQANYTINGMTASGPNATVSFTTNGINAGNQIINGVKAGVAGTDAVNVDQLNAAVNKAVAGTAKATTVVAGKNATVTEGTNAAGGKEYTVAINEHLTNMKSAAFHSDGVMPGSGGDTHISGSGIHVNDLEDNNSVNISPKTIYVRTEGYAQSDLKSDELRIQNYDNGNASLLLNTDGLYVGNGTPGTTVQFTTKGISAGDQKIENVKAGTADTDAVNVKQLKDYVSNNNTIVKAGDNIEVKADGNTYTVSTAKDLTNLNSINLNDGNNETNFNTKGIEMTYRGDGANGLEYHTTYNYNGLTIKTNDGDANPVSEVSLTDKGLNNGGNRITNVGKGIDGTDGVNVKQLKDELAKNRAVESVITDNQIDNIAAVRVTNGKSTGEANAQYGVYVSKNTVTDIAKASNQFKGDDVIRVERTTGANHTADTTTFKFDGNEASKVIPISYKANGGTVNKVTAEKGFNFVDGNHIKASTDTNGVVRFDLDQEIPKQIERNTTNIEKITNRYDALTTKVAKNYKTAERGIAGTAALAALHPLDFDPDHKLDVMAGVGHFHGSNSVALGAAYRPNEDLMFTVGSTVGNGDTVLNAGVSYKVGAKSDISRSKVAVAKDVADMKREMAEMKAQNAKITAILNTVLGVGLPEDQNVMFPDVPQNHWAFEAVDDLARRGLIIGYEDGLFKGDRTLTRYEFAEVVHRAIQRAKALNVPIDGRLVDEFKPELLRFEVEKNGSLERVHALKSNRDIKRDSYGTIVGVR